MAGQDSWTDPQSGAPTPPKKKGMSGCMLASVIVGGIGLVCGVVCCGGLAWFGAKFAPVQAKTPTEMLAVAKLILNTEVIDGFNPSAAETWDNPIYTMRIAEFKQKEGKGELLMWSVSGKMNDQNMAKAQTIPLREMHSKKLTDGVIPKKSESHDVVINGQNVSIAIGEATDRTTGKAIRTVTAEFEQPGASLYIFLIMDEDIWNEEAVLKMFQDAKPQ